jgi:hypothetical protein
MGVAARRSETGGGETGVKYKEAGAHLDNGRTGLAFPGSLIIAPEWA